MGPDSVVSTSQNLTVLTADGNYRSKERREKVCPRCKNALIDDSLMTSGCDRFQTPTSPPPDISDDSDRQRGLDVLPRADSLLSPFAPDS